MNKPLCFLMGVLTSWYCFGQEPVVQTWSARLGDAVTAPVWNGTTAKSAGQPGFTNFLNISSRETARQFFNLVYGASDNVPMQWSGNYTNGTPGTNSDEYLLAVRRRVNYFREMAGVPAAITFSNEYSRKAQAAAFMMGANNNIDHYPPTNWLYYTADGAEAARSSNLSLGTAGPDAVTGQMRDNAANNTAAGHRRWIIYPQTRTMGSGNVPGIGTNYSADDLWVFDTHTFDARPATRDSFVSWPPPGFVPYQMVFPRWSFAYPNADLSQAAVSMTSNGAPLSVSLEAQVNGYGENTLVWVPTNLNANTMASLPRPGTDTVYHVTLANVKIGGSPQTFNYDVRVFDPGVGGADYSPVQVIGTAQPFVNASNGYAFSAVSNASAYQWRASALLTNTFTDGAENGLTNFTVNAATNLYAVRDSSVKYAGSYSFHLAHPETVSQILTLNRSFLVRSNSAVQFYSRLGYASPLQVARVQLSLDNGISWNDIYTQPGSGGAGEASFNVRTLPLASYAGRTVTLRLNYDINLGSYFPQASAGVGWYVDNFAVTNALQVVPSASINAVGSAFAYSPTNAGSYLLEGRPLLFGDYEGEWGPGLMVTAIQNTNVSVRITGITKVSGSTWNIDFTLQSGFPAGFELWSTAAFPGPFAREAGATMQTIIAGSRYRAVVTAAGSQRFFLIKPL